MADNVVATYYYPPMEVAAAELGQTAGSKLDDDGRNKRTGTMWTASSHIITAVIGSGVLSLGWAIAQLGWVAGPAVMLLFSLVTYFTSSLLADCYRSGDQSTGKRNYTYMDAVNANLSGIKVQICGVLQYANIVGVSIGYTIAASISMLAIKRANCFHGNGHADPCKVSSVPYMIIFGVAQVFFSQIPDFDQISWLSMLAAAMSFTYSSIGLGLGIVQVIANGGVKGSLTGISIGTVTPMQKVWRSTQAFGDIAFAYSYSLILIEIQDTIRAPPPSESTVMKRANKGISNDDPPNRTPHPSTDRASPGTLRYQHVKPLDLFSSLMSVRLKYASSFFAKMSSNLSVNLADDPSLFSFSSSHFYPQNPILTFLGGSFVGSIGSSVIHWFHGQWSWQ
uniref:Amino acid transporter transmembrane domain-containing protein n=1 Tax=Aegilops tauschii TaxID=37682 RepID=N1QW78_AEGTA